MENQITQISFHKQSWKKCAIFCWNCRHFKKMATILNFSGGKCALFIQLCLDNICTKFDACITNWKILPYIDLICWAIVGLWSGCGCRLLHRQCLGIRQCHKKTFLILPYGCSIGWKSYETTYQSSGSKATQCYRIGTRYPWLGHPQVITVA